MPNLKIHNRVGHILKVLRFNSKTSDTDLIEAIRYYQSKSFIGNKAPLSFILQKDRPYFYDQKGQILSMRYKLHLFKQVATAIKSGTLNLLDSSKYLSIEEYLLEENYWEVHKTEIMKHSGLSEYLEADKVLSQQVNWLDQQYKNTNHRMLSGENDLFRLDRKGKIFVQTPAVSSTSSGAIHQLIKSVSAQRVNLIEVLVSTQDSSNFLEDFQHFSLKYAKKSPSEKDLIAVLMAYGCNIGISQMTLNTKGIQTKQLKHTSEWFFSLENLQNANERVLDSITLLDVSDLLVEDRNFIKTASDGQKIPVKSKNPSLNARYSYKYF